MAVTTALGREYVDQVVAEKIADDTSDIAQALARFDAVPTRNPLSSGEATLARDLNFLTVVPTGSANVRLTYFTATKTEAITQVRLISGGTAAGATPTVVRVGIYSVAESGDLTLVASTANDTTLLSAANTRYTKALGSTWNKVAGARYAVGLLVVTAATAPTIVGIGSNLPAAELGVAPRMCAILGGQADLPASIAAGALSDLTVMAYMAFLP